MDDAVQLNKCIDTTVAALTRRLADAHQRKARADREAAMSATEIAVISKALLDFKPLQGFFGSITAAAAGAANAADRGSNRQIVIDILTEHGAPMTNSEIAKIAHQRDVIKSKKGEKGIYATIATVLARGSNNVFLNHAGQWDLRDRRLKPSDVPSMNHLRPVSIPSQNLVEIPQIKVGQ